MLFRPTAHRHGVNSDSCSLGVAQRGEPVCVCKITKEERPTGKAGVKTQLPRWETSVNCSQGLLIPAV